MYTIVNMMYNEDMKKQERKHIYTKAIRIKPETLKLLKKKKNGTKSLAGFLDEIIHKQLKK